MIDVFPRRSSRRVRWAALGALLTTTACSSGPPVIEYPTPPSIAPTTSTTVFDYSGIALPLVPGRTTTTVDNQPGRANLRGTVTGPDGPVPVASVRVERLVQDAVLPKDVTTGADGVWRLDLIRGGRYRVRAWKAPDLAQVEPQIFYLGGDETRSLSLTTSRYTGLQAGAVFAPSPPVVNEPAALSVVITTASVDGQGIVRGTPQASTSVQLLTGLGDWRLESSAVQVTDAAGSAQWRLTCSSPGTRPLSVIVGTGSPVTLAVPPCDDGISEPPPPPRTSPNPTLSSTPTTAANRT